MKIREKYNACKQRFKNLSLKKKLLLFYTALFLLPLLLISIIIYVEVSQSMTEKIQFSATQGYEPVSYTHLDVYKRQHFKRSMWYRRLAGGIQEVKNGKKDIIPTGGRLPSWRRL